MKKGARKIVVIAGAGPAGLTAALELLRSNPDYKVTIFEKSDAIGGISQTVNYKGNRIDIGGHRFFSKNKRVNDFWESILPSDADPETTDRTMLRRPRVSRIYYLRRFFDYPVKINLATIKKLGLSDTFAAGISYLSSLIHKRPEKNLEDFYINRFGRKLYSMFFEDYTEKVWGKHPSHLGAEWGAQRVKGLSLKTVLKNLLSRKQPSPRTVETSLIEEFLYPKFGPGQLWEAVADEIRKLGGTIIKQERIYKVHLDQGRVAAVTIEDASGHRRDIRCDFFLSSMPLKDLFQSLDGINIPSIVRNSAISLPYRDFITVGLLVDHLNIKNETKLQTYLDRIPDTWIYVQERDVKLGRIQVFNNWSPYMVADNANKMWIGLEYFCNEGDILWNQSKEEFIRMAVKELEQIGIVDEENVEDAVCIKMQKAYPAYFGSYTELPRIRNFLDGIPNLYCIGRNGQHRYNNMDHSMLTAMEAADLIEKCSTTCRPTSSLDKRALWNVNTESSYHETASDVRN